jgi:hypothetical protein
MPSHPTGFNRIPSPVGACFRQVAALLAIAGLTAATATAGTDTIYAVQATAMVQAAPPQITLVWTAGPPATVNGYALARKEPGAATWTPLINLTGDATNYVDTNVAVGRLYEYRIVRQMPGQTGYGYLAAGIDLPAVDSRGKVVLVVDGSIAAALAADIDQLASDLVGDGWTVVRRDVGRDDAPAAVRETIRAAYNEDRANVRAVFLLGHVPVVRSGNLNVDGHGGRPLPADAYYGDVDGTWTDANNDGVLDQDFLPSDVELMVGRVDFAAMPGFPDETTLLQRYLKKDHEFRHAIRRVTPRALVGDRTEDADGEAFGAVAFRTFPALLGPNRLTIANIADNSPTAERWISRLTATDWLWVFGSGGANVTLISGLGVHGQFNDVWSADLVDQHARGTFYLLLGSWFVDWSQPDNIMQAALAAPDYGLTAAWSGRPHLFFQHMAMGEPIGYGIRLSQNNSTLYTNQVNRFPRGIHIALLGDPTLRQQVVAPPSGLKVAAGGGSPALTWTASPDADAGYHVYRAASEAGPFSRVTSAPVSLTSFTDFSAPAGTFSYQVRAVHREFSGSGSYFNQSQAVFATATVTNPTSSSPSAPATGPSGGSGGTGAAGGGGGAISIWSLAALAVLLFQRARARR